MVRRALATLLAAGCGPQVMPSADTDAAAESSTGPDVEDVGEPGFSVMRDVDILFVIDNSATMAEEQLLLAEGLDVLIAALETPNVDANYRIAFITTDNDNG